MGTVGGAEDLKLYLGEQGGGFWHINSIRETK